MILTQIEYILVFAGLIMLFRVIYYHRSISKRLSDTKTIPKLKKYPSVSILRPIKGLDAGIRGNVQNALNPGYPGNVETIFIFDDDKDEAYPLVKEEIETFKIKNPTVNANILFSGNPPKNRTGKLNAMIKGYEVAKNELIAIADSDTRNDRKLLTKLVETLESDPKAGSAFVPVIVSESFQTIGDAGYALMLNGLYTPEAKSNASKHGWEMPFIMGQFMLFKREAIDKIGGFETAEGQLVDDMYIGRRVHEEGLKNLVCPNQIKIIQYGLSIKDFWKIYIKWITFSRSGLPGLTFKLGPWIRGMVFWFSLIFSVASFLMGYQLAGIINGLVTLAVSQSINMLHQDAGGAQIKFRHSWVSFGILLIAPIVYSQILMKQEVTWRGRVYNLNSDSKLSTK
ncbi:MAG: glycosyltransferase [Pseudomonadota bacterium]